jgi:transposase-like protein
MGQVLHGCAKTTQRVRQEIQNSQESIRVLAKRYHLNPQTVLKWRHRDFVQDMPMGPKNPRSTVLSLSEEAIIVAFRRHTLLPLDDCLYSLQETIPHLTRSSLHRCLKRHGMSRIPREEEDENQKKKFKDYPLGYFHLDIAEVHTEEGKLYLFVAIDRTSKFVYVELLEKYGKIEAAQFLRNLMKAVPYQIHTILTDNGVQFTHRPTDKKAGQHIFDKLCEDNKIRHRLTKVAHPWTNGQVERMNRTLKEATVKKYHYETHQQLKEHLSHFVNAYNFAKRLKALKGLTPYEFIVKQWEQEPKKFINNPIHYNMGLYI